MTVRNKTGYKLRTPEQIALSIRSLHPELKRKVKSALKATLSDPDHAGKHLKEDLEGLQSFRVGRARLIYRVARNHAIEIVAFGPRKTIYEETYRILKKDAKRI
jgi:mRNA interferase RelE/StbE